MGKLTIDSNQQVIDASVPQADAQHLVSTDKKSTKEDQDVNEFIELCNSIEEIMKGTISLKVREEMDSNFFNHIDEYSIGELRNLDEGLENISSVNDKVKSHIRFRIMTM